MSLNTLPEPQKSGLLLIDKPADFSSHDIIAVARRILKTKKIGHSGTLDPMATGLLILLVGREATRLQERFLKLDKTYQATLKLGEETASWDAYSEVINTKPVPPLSPEKVQAAMQKLTGIIRQPIPFYSAKRVNGQRMYELARDGKEIERKYNEVRVAWENVNLTAADEISFCLHGSCGTYVRAVGFLLAEQLGTVGHLTQLRRLSIGGYKVENAFDGNRLKTCATDELYKWVEPVL